MKKVVHVSGKRKKAIARATLKEGKGIIKINNQPLDIYQPEIARMKITEPLLISGNLAKTVNIKVNVMGGGWQAQAEASRLAIAKALVEFSGSKSLKQQFLDYDRHLLVADVRRNEPHKPNDSKPRAKRQKSYR
ncbi:MAG: 30S ribosomal protein S9 [Candidatus Woesearchaeota archaeon]|nr:30S ribosomal protein S9 [Candidatus Woesearchaeota archaeon]